MRAFVPAQGAVTTLLGVVVVASLGTTAVLAQAPILEPVVAPGASGNPGTPPPAGSTTNPVPTLPTTAGPPGTVVSEPATREALLEERIRQLESMVNRLSAQVNQLVPQPGALPDSTVGGPAPRGAAAADVGVPATVIAPSATGGVGAPGQSLPPNPIASSRFNSPATLDKAKANVIFGPGFRNPKQ